MRRLWILWTVCAWTLAGALLSLAAPEMSTGQRAAFRTAHTVRVISQISHKETPGIVVMAPGAIAPGAFTQPFEEIARNTLEPSGLRVISGPDSATADLTFRVRGSYEETLTSMTLRFGGARPTVSVAGLGARWEGTVTVSAPNVPDYTVSFEGEADFPGRQGKQHLDREQDQTQIVMQVSQAAIHALLAYGSYAFAITEVMGQIHGPEPLLAMLNDTERHQAFRAAAARTLGAVGSEGSFERLMQALNDQVPDVRAGAAEGLGRLRDPRAFDPLLKALQKPGERMQASAASGLGALGDKRATGPLVDATLKNSSDVVSGKAAEALGQIRDASASETLCTALQDKSPNTRRRAARALGTLGDPGAIPPLMAAAKDQDASVRLAAVQALGAAKNPRGTEALVGALKDSDGSVRSEAALALGRSGDAQALEPLVAALAVSDTSFRGAVIKALGELGDRRAGPQLLPLLRDKDISTRQSAAASLGRVGDASCFERLLATLKDKSPQVRSAAAGALEQLTRQRFGEDRKQWGKWWKQNKKSFSPAL